MLVALTRSYLPRLAREPWPAARAIRVLPSAHLRRTVLTPAGGSPSIQTAVGISGSSCAALTRDQPKGIERYSPLRKTGPRLLPRAALAATQEQPYARNPPFLFPADAAPVQEIPSGVRAIPRFLRAVCRRAPRHQANRIRSVRRGN